MTSHMNSVTMRCHPNRTQCFHLVSMIHDPNIMGEAEVVSIQDHNHQRNLHHRRERVDQEPMQERQQRRQSEPSGPKKPTRSNLSLKSPPTPVMFSEDSLSADEDEQLVTSTNEWTYPNVDLAGRKMKAFKRMHLGKGDKEVVIILCVNQGTSEDPCGAYDESLIPTLEACSLVTDWEILLRRTTVYLAAWAEGIISPKVLRKYISKGNPEWVRLYRYIWLKSQANHLVVFPSPKTFALATCTSHSADEKIRQDVINNTKLPPAKTNSSYDFLMVKGERTIVISDLPLNWMSTSKNVNDIQSLAQTWGWNSIQQYAPTDYEVGVNYLEQPCTSVATLIERAEPENDLKTATIHVWVSMTDIINYAKVRGGGVSFSVKDSSTEISSYFMSCLQKLSDAGRARNPIVININADGEFLKCHDTTKFKRVTKDIVNELRGEGYLVSWGGHLWRELFPFLDAHGRIKAKGWGEKVVAVAIMEKQLYREKTLLKCMFSPQRVNELDHKATLSRIANNEGLVDEPPDEYRYENVNAIPLDPNSKLGKGGRKVRAKMHVPNWDNQPKASYQPSVVQDDKFFWTLVYRGPREESEDDPMVSLSGLCDSCAINGQLDRSDFPDHKECPNCSANYTLRSYGEFTEVSDRKMKVYLAHRAKTLYDGDEDWLSYDPSSDLKGFMKMTIRVLLNTDLGKAISQYGFVRMHPSAAAKLLGTSRGHMIVTTRFKKPSEDDVNFRFSYDMGNKLYAAYVHALFSQVFMRDTFGHENPKEEKLSIEIVLGLMEIWDSVPHRIPANLSSQKVINEIRRGVECSLIHFCSIGETRMSSKNRKLTKRKGLSEDVPDEITDVASELNYYIPENEGTEDFSPFTELLEEAEEEPEAEGDDDEDAEMIYSSGEETEVNPDEQEEAKDQDDPMEGVPEDGPEAKRRKVALMIESIPNTAKDEGVCLACGEIGHTMLECPRQEDVDKVSSAFDTILSKFQVKKTAFPKARRTQEKKKERPGRMSTEERPDTVTTLYPEEVTAFDKSAEFQGGHRTVMGKETKLLGPETNDVIVDDILPEMDELNGVYRITERMNLTKEEEKYYAHIERSFPVGTLAIVPMNGTMYRHEQFDDHRYLSKYDKADVPEYPRKETNQYKAGYLLNRILRHHIGRAGSRATEHKIFRCNEGAWVLLKDLLEQDFLWYDGCEYLRAKRYNHNQYLEIKRRRIGLIVDLAVAESRRMGKCRFQILGLRAEDQDEFEKVKEEFEKWKQRIREPPSGADFMDELYNGWIMPVAVRATSGHSYLRKHEVGITLDPMAVMRRLDMKTAMKLQGAYHVTSPSYLESILANGLMPGGTAGKRITNFFGIFPPWDPRNRVTRTRSPISEDLYMLVIYVPPSELTRFDAGVSGTGDILVPNTIPPEEIREMWIARKCAAQPDENGINRWVVTKPRKIYSKQLVQEIVTYADYQHLGRPGYIATREQVIDDAILLIKKFPKPPVGHPEDLEELKKDVRTLEEGRGRSLRLLG